MDNRSTPCPSKAHIVEWFSGSRRRSRGSDIRRTDRNGVGLATAEKLLCGVSGGAVSCDVGPLVVVSKRELAG